MNIIITITLYSQQLIIKNLLVNENTIFVGAYLNMYIYFSYKEKIKCYDLCYINKEILYVFNKLAQE